MALAGRRLAPTLLVVVLHLLPHGTTPTRYSDDSDGGRKEGSNGRMGAVNLSEGTQAGPSHGRDRRSHDHDDNSRNLVGVRVEFVDEFARADIDIDDGRLFDEPPRLASPVPDKWVQRCSRFNESDFEHGADCGGPMSEPCFEWSRCQAGGGSKIYVYDQECSEADSKNLPNANHDEDDLQHQSSYWVDAARNAGMLAETYEEACLFIHVNTHNHDEPCAVNATLWNEGANHVMMEFTPWWKHGYERSSISNTYAMDWAFDSLSCYYRTGFDLSVPLRPGKIFPEYESTPATARKYFMTFKGTIYLRGYGLEERSAVSRLHDPASRIVSVVKCSTMHGDERLPENRDYCDRSKRRYDTYDYGDLMNSTFALAPSGRSPGTFRLGEIMSAGAIPVFVVRDWVKPAEEKIDWPSFSFSFTPDQVGPKMTAALRAVPPGELAEMQRKSIEAYWKIFGGVTDYSVIAANTIDVLTQRLGFHR